MSKFKINDRVRVTKGFYRGQTGVCLNMVSWLPFEFAREYFIMFDNKTLFITSRHIFSGCLEKLKVE